MFFSDSILKATVKKVSLSYGQISKKVHYNRFFPWPYGTDAVVVDAVRYLPAMGQRVKGTGTRDLIWIKVVSLDRSW